MPTPVAENGTVMRDPVERLAALPTETAVPGGVNPPCEISAVFKVHKSEDLTRIFEGRHGPDDGFFVYGRHYSPSVCHLGRQLAALEGTEAGYATASGLSSIACALLSLCNTGDHIVASNTLYGGTFALLSHFFPAKMGITTTFVNIDDWDAVNAAVQPRTKVLYAETLSNPTLRMVDLPRLAEVAHARGLTCVVDNTFASLTVSPAGWGVDVVVQSLTKYTSGSGDIVAGSVCSSKAFIDRMMDLHESPCMMLGPTMDPRTASELSLRLPHLGLRVAEHSRRALAVAERLQQEGVSVQYPGLKSHPHHDRFNRLCNPGSYGYGGMLTVDMGSYDAAVTFMELLQNEQNFGHIAVSLGYHDNLMCASASSTSSHLTADELHAAGIQPGLIRISTGITGSLPQRMQQLVQAVQSVKQHQ